jgi:hypothetical protein
MLKLIGDLQRSSQRTAAGSTMNRIGRRMILCMLLMAALVIIWNSSYLAASRQNGATWV